MTTLSTLYPTLLDVSSRLGPDGKVVKDIIEILDQDNEILDDIVWKEGNLPTGELTTIRTGLPEPTFRKLYGYVSPSKSLTDQITESCGMLEDYAVIDVKLAEINGNKPEWFMSEQKPHIQGFNRKLSRYLFHGNEATEPEGFTGFGPRFNLSSAENGVNIIREGGAQPDNSDNASIYLVVWSPETVFGLYPKGSQAGLSISDDGIQTETDSNGAKRKVYQTHYKWECGLCVKDWRYVVRIQVNQEDLVKNAASGADLIDLMTQATELIPNLNAGRPAFYMNRTLRGFLRRQIQNKTANTLTVEQVLRGNGMKAYVPMFDGIPVRRCDALLNTETGIA